VAEGSLRTVEMTTQRVGCGSEYGLAALDPKHQERTNARTCKQFEYRNMEPKMWYACGVQIPSTLFLYLLSRRQCLGDLHNFFYGMQAGQKISKRK